MNKCRQCKQDKAEQFFAKGKGGCKDCRAFSKRKIKRQPTTEEISSFYDYYVSKCTKLFTADDKYPKLVSDGNLKVWHSREVPPPLHRDIPEFWREEIVKGLVRDALVIDDLRVGSYRNLFNWFGLLIILLLSIE